MFLTVLGSALVVGTGLLAAASYTEGALIGLRTAAQGIGWLLLTASAVGLSLLGRASVAKAGAAAVAFLSGAAMLYLTYFEWGELSATPVRQAVAAAADWHADPKFVASLPLAPVLVSAPIGASVPGAQPAPVAASAAIGAPVIKAQTPPMPAETVAVVTAKPAVVEDACSSLMGLESLQCRRCGDKTGLARIFCQESARIEYCENRPDDEASCLSSMPYTPPG